MSTEYSVTLARINQDAYQSVLNMYNEQEPLIREDLENLGAFGTSLNQRLNELQNALVKVPSEEELKSEEVGRLGTFWRLHATMVRTNELMRNLNGVMTLLNQPPRAPEQQARLQADYPELTTTLTQVDEAAKTMFAELNSHYQHVDSIYKKMSLQMSTTAWEMMKFSDIVANQGHPLSAVRRIYNYVGTPVVRKLTQEELAPRSEASGEPSAPVQDPVEEIPISSSDASSSIEPSLPSSAIPDTKPAVKLPPQLVAATFVRGKKNNRYATRG